MKRMIFAVLLFIVPFASVADSDKTVIECVELKDDGKVFNGVKEVLVIDLEEKLIEYVGTPDATGDSIWFQITKTTESEIRAKKWDQYGSGTKTTMTINRYSLQMQVIWDHSYGDVQHLDPTWYRCEKGRSRPQL